MLEFGPMPQNKEREPLSRSEYEHPAWTFLHLALKNGLDLSREKREPSGFSESHQERWQWLRRRYRLESIWFQNDAHNAFELNRSESWQIFFKQAKTDLLMLGSVLRGHPSFLGLSQEQLDESSFFSDETKSGLLSLYHQQVIWTLQGKNRYGYFSEGYTTEEMRNLIGEHSLALVQTGVLPITPRRFKREVGRLFRETAEKFDLLG